MRMRRWVALRDEGLGCAVQADGHASTLLIVDDDPAIVRMLAQRLGSVGYRVLSAGTGRDALELVTNTAVDIALCDINMPGMDGFELLASIRRHRSAGDLPVIMLSARDRGPDVIQALRLGANDYATKPVRLEELEGRIEAHLALKAVEGQVVRGYQLVRRLGSGAMGVICEAQEVETGRTVALKVLKRSYSLDRLAVGRFLREAELASRVTHPNVVRTYTAGIDGQTHYIAMELVRGCDLATLIKGTPLELSAALGIARQVVLALKAMATVGVVHRDIKPENVLVSLDGNVKVTDFGIAHDVKRTHRLTGTGFGVGTLAYASPEQLHGDAGEGTDIYGLGCTLFFMITGDDPFDGQKPLVALNRDKLRSPRRVTARASGLSPDAARLIQAMLAPVAARRPAADEVLEAVDALLAGVPVTLPSREPFWESAWAALFGH
jgi:serine/threonine protein kinase